ncbi:MAG: DUF4190 domain-containing protein [Acidobacteria bacterium]|nr:DUF4190 domain-containing protein [Acidobacteriota bacterium]
MLCTNGHNNEATATHCQRCGVDTFQVAPIVVSAPVNGFAIAALVLGIIWVYWIGSILAVIFAFVAFRQIRRRGERGRGLAIAGLVLGLVGLLTLTGFVSVVAFISHHHTPVG